MKEQKTVPLVDSTIESREAEESLERTKAELEKEESEDEVEHARKSSVIRAKFNVVEDDQRKSE